MAMTKIIPAAFRADTMVKASKINNPNDNELLLLSFINYKLGKNYDLKTIESKSLQVVNEGGNYYFENPYLLLSQIYSIRNNKSEAYRWFDQAIDEGFSDYKLLLSNPLYDNIRGSTTYNSLINKMKDHVDRERLEAGLES